MKLSAVATGDSAAVAWPAFTWHSSDTTVAVVDSAGVVLGMNTGRATIRAESGGLRDSITVRIVLQRADLGVAFSSFTTETGRNCALTAAGIVYCRTTSTFDSIDKFTPLAGSEHVALTSLHSAATHTCGLTAAGAMYCWGNNYDGQFLTGGRTRATALDAPAPSDGSMRFVSIGVGRQVGTTSGYTCGVNKVDSVVYCAGLNQFQQLGRSTTLTSDTVAAPVTGNFRAIVVAASVTAYTCALTPTRLAYCWGNVGSVEFPGAPSSTPHLMSASVQFATLAMGVNHMCAIAIDGALYCWGRNNLGQLGIDTVDTRPHTVPELVRTSLRFVSVALGNNHTCGVSAENALYCWRSFLPATVSDRLGARRNVPVRIAPAFSFRSVNSDGVRTCALTTDKQIFCF